MTKKTECVFTNLTFAQAIALAEWFAKQGEQNCECWFEERGCESPQALTKTVKDGKVYVECISPSERNK